MYEYFGSGQTRNGGLEMANYSVFLYDWFGLFGGFCGLSDFCLINGGKIDFILKDLDMPNLWRFGISLTKNFRINTNVDSAFV